MAIYHQDIAVVELNSGSLHRSFLNHSIGLGDAAANRFGVRVFRDGEAETLSGVTCQGFFRNANGENIALTSYGTIDGNMAYVTLPQACYNVEGMFTLAIKLVGGGVTGTMRIVDGVVDNTNTGGAVAPTGSVPTYQEVLSVYSQMQDALDDYADVVATQNGQIDDLKSAIHEITGNSKITFTTKKFIALNSSTADVNNMLTPSGNCNCAVVPCTAGDKFTVYATGGNSARAWGFVAENGSILSVENAGISVNGVVLTAPENAVYLVINDNSAPPSYSYVGDGVLIEKVNKITTQFDAYGIRSANRFDKNSSDNQNGVYLVTSSGATANLSNYTTSGFLDISDIDSLTLCYVHIYCFYDETMAFIPNSGGSNSGYAAHDYIVNVPSTAKYIRVSFPTERIDTVQIGQGVTRTNYVAYNEQFIFKKLSLETPVIVVASDGTGNYTSFTEAIYDTWDSGIDVVVKPGIYDIKAEYIALFGQTVVDDMADSTDLNGFQFGVRLYNRKITFESGSHLVCDWSTQTVSGSRRFSAIRVDSDVVIDGMDLDVTGAFYAVHDDYGPNALPFTNVYKNCRIVGHSLTNANCIGGGCKRYSRHILENCYFDNGRTNVTTVRYHNYALNQDAEPVIWVSNCYFNSLFTPRWAGTQTTKMRVYVNNCYAESIYKLAEGSSTNDNIELIKWNNTETTPRD